MANVRTIGLMVAALALLADQVIKSLLLYEFDFIVMRQGEAVEVTPFFNLVMVWNRGISYGLFQADSLLLTRLLTLFQLSAVALLTWWLFRADRKPLGIGLGLVIGGALGNVIDRIRFSAVADFFHFHIGELGFYVFNIADAAITMGVILLLWDAFLRPDQKGEDAVTQSTNSGT
jgi:signal peptidase II